MVAELKKQIWGMSQQGRHDEVIEQALVLVQSHPFDAELQYMLGCSYAQLQQWQEATATLQSCISMQPNVAQAYFALAGVQLAQGLEKEGVESLQKTLSLNNQLPDVHISLANALMSSGDLDAARKHFQAALEIKPDHSYAHLGLGKVERERVNHQVALAHYEDALKYNPNFSEAICCKASAILNLAKMSNQADIQNAIDNYKKALTIEPDYLDAISGLALCYEYISEFELAKKLITPIIDKGIKHTTIGLVYARLSRKFNLCDEAVAYVNEVLENTRLHKNARKNLHFAAGRVLDYQKKYELAFEHYKKGNECGQQFYDAQANYQNVTDIINTFTPAYFMRTPKGSREENKPVFIIGMPRSGTSLTEQILSMHSEVYGAGELSTINELMLKLPSALNVREMYPHCMGKIDQETITQFSKEYLNKINSLSSEASRIIDKMPHNFFLLGLIQLLFPGAHIIHIKRNAIDTCLSIYFQNFSDGHSYSTNLYDIGTHYNQYEKLMAHWKNVLSIPMLEINYEDMVNDQEAVTRQLLNFCELDWQENCLDFHKAERTVHTPSYDQVREPMYNKSIERWRNYEPYLEDLKRGLSNEY